MLRFYIVRTTIHRTYCTTIQLYNYARMYCYCTSMHDQNERYRTHYNTSYVPYCANTSYVLQHTYASISLHTIVIKLAPNKKRNSKKLFSFVHPREFFKVPTVQQSTTGSGPIVSKTHCTYSFPVDLYVLRVP